MSLALPSEGGCQCGEIRYRLTGEPVWLAVCHCNDCKSQSGGVFGMSLRMREADVKLISGEPKCWTRPPRMAGGPNTAISAEPAGYAFGTPVD